VLQTGVVHHQLDGPDTARHLIRREVAATVSDDDCQRAFDVYLTPTLVDEDVIVRSHTGSRRLQKRLPRQLAVTGPIVGHPKHDQ